MIHYSKTQSTISVFLIFALLSATCGCKTSKLIQTSELPLKNKEEVGYIIHGKNLRYLLREVVIHEGYLSAHIDTTAFTGGDHSVHLWLRADTLLKRFPNDSVRLSLNDVSKAKVRKTSTGLTLAAILVPTAIVCSFLLLYQPFKITIPDPL